MGGPRAWILRMVSVEKQGKESEMKILPNSLLMSPVHSCTPSPPPPVGEDRRASRANRAGAAVPEAQPPGRRELYLHHTGAWLLSDCGSFFPGGDHSCAAGQPVPSGAKARGTLSLERPGLCLTQVVV